MGFTFLPKTYRLTFGDDTEYAGLEIVQRAVTLGELLELDAIESQSQTTADELAVIVRLIVDHNESWNVEDEQGQPVPCTIEALHGQPPDVVWTIRRQWLDAVKGVPADDPLDDSSTSGEPSEVASIPTETLSASRAS